MKPYALNPMPQIPFHNMPGATNVVQNQMYEGQNYNNMDGGYPPMNQGYGNGYDNTQQPIQDGQEGQGGYGGQGQPYVNIPNIDQYSHYKPTYNDYNPYGPQQPGQEGNPY